MKIAVFGASVSAQARNHKTGEITGYSEVLREDYLTRLGATEIRRITYPGNRLSDGGMLRLAHVLAFKPDICIFEPLIEDGTRGVRSTAAEIRFVYLEMLRAGILPVTVLLPDTTRGPAASLPNYAIYQGLCRAYQLPVLEIDLTGVSDLEAKFDRMHTKLEGARLYANRIAAFLQTLGNCQSIISHALERAKTQPSAHVYIQQLTQPLPRGPVKRLTGLSVELQHDMDDPVSFRLVQHQRLGPFSPVLDGQFSPDGSPFQISVWDPFCHFERDSYVMLCSQTIAPGLLRTLSLDVAETRPDYASCRRQVLQWPSALYMCPLAPPVIISQSPLIARLVRYNQC